MPPKDVGQLDRLIDIEARTAAQDAHGDSDTWAAITGGSNLPAKIEAAKGRELEQAQQTQSELGYRIWIRYLAGVDTKMRINESGALYDIREVLVRGRNEWLEIVATVQNNAS